MEYCKDDFRMRSNIDISNNLKALAKLRLECEAANRNLSYDESTIIDVKRIY